MALEYRRLYTLPAPLRDPASAALSDGRFALLGGLDGADSSSDEIQVADHRRVLHSGSLPGAQHDAQGALLGEKVYVFGGGDFTQYDHILGYDPVSGTVSPAGTLPSPASDVAVAGDGSTAYIVGGFDGSSALDTIVAWSPGTSARVVGHLPVELRYAAVSVARGGLLIIGGSTPSGASDAIYRFDLDTHRVRQIGRLAHGVTHGGAAALGSTVYLVGGRGDLLDSQTTRVWGIDALTGRVRAAGRLPVPTSDAAVIASDGVILVAGGQSPTDTLAGVGELVAARPSS